MSVYNAASFLEEALNSIIQQTFKDWELIIADDGSQDSSMAIIDRFENLDSRIITSHNDRNCGKTATINRLFELSGGEFVTIHDGDDVSMPLRFDRQLSEFGRNPDLVMCGTWFEYMTKTGEVLYVEETPFNYKQVQVDIRKTSIFHGPTVVTKRKIIKQMGEFLRPFFRDYHEDSDFNIRVSECGECYNIPEVLYQYRIVPGSLSKTLSPRKLVLYEVVTHLAWQREAHGQDDLQLGNTKKVEELLESKIYDLMLDPFKVYHQMAEKYGYFKLYQEAFYVSRRLFLKKPLSLNSLRLLLYCFRKQYFR